MPVTVFSPYANQLPISLVFSFTYKKSQWPRAGLPLNSVVRILKLQKRPELNGQLGTVVGWDTFEDRCQVRLVDGSGLLLKACNMELVSGNRFQVPDRGASKTPPDQPPTRSPPKPDEAVKPRITPDTLVKIKGIKVRPELNGLQGVVTAWDPPSESWAVRLHGAEASAQNLFGVVKNFREEHLEVPAGEAEPQPFVKAGLPLNSVVRILKLQKRPELNGQLGTVVGWDTVEDRCQVRLVDGSGLLLKACNIELVSGNGFHMPDGGASKTSPDRPPTGSPKPDEAVKPPPTGSPKPDEAVKPRIAPNILVRIKGIKVRPELNGLQGVVTAWDPREESWAVRLHGAEASAQNLFGVVKNFREEDLEVPAGEAEPQPFVKAGLPLNSVVRILKLQKRPELNGQLGTVVGWDTVEDRCQVRLVDGSGLLLKACNIELVSGKGFHMPDEGATEPSTGSPKPDEAVKPLRPPPGLPKPDEAVKLPPTGSPKPDEAVKPLRPPTGSPKPDEAVKPPPTGSPKPDEAVKPPPTGSPKPDENRFGVKNSREEHFEAPAGEAEPQPLLKAGLPLNSVVRLLGLQKRPELNGQLGTVVGWDTVEDRCQVRLGDGSGLLLKACNMEPVPKDAWRRTWES
ncbi:unnamed protein product [Cladocopium goreaui]|uniref:Uncharacterized protein n=1 Tax=Cladocopium goreaui TaxID=2562237 RepID=A0A9P1G3T2_9DINO|nr:unnamed protein product [Cladocopium goreaui]